jgi:hypothetical protein
MHEREHENASHRPFHAPSSISAGVPIKERVKRMSVVDSTQSSRPMPVEKASLSHLLEKGHPSGLQSAAEQTSSADSASSHVKDRIKRLSVAAVASPQHGASPSSAIYATEAPLRSPAIETGNAVPIKERVKRLSLVAAAVAALPVSSSTIESSSDAFAVQVPVEDSASSQQSVHGATAISIKDRVKRLSVVAGAVASTSNPASPSVPSSSEYAARGEAHADAAAAVSIKDRIKRMSVVDSTPNSRPMPGEKASLSQLLEKDFA